MCSHPVSRPRKTWEGMDEFDTKFKRMSLACTPGSISLPWTILDVCNGFVAGGDWEYVSALAS